jgi:chromosome segregation ATPase
MAQMRTQSNTTLETYQELPELGCKQLLALEKLQRLEKQLVESQSEIDILHNTLDAVNQAKDQDKQSFTKELNLVRRELENQKSQFDLDKYSLERLLEDQEVRNSHLQKKLLELEEIVETKNAQIESQLYELKSLQTTQKSLDIMYIPVKRRLIIGRRS